MYWFFSILVAIIVAIVLIAVFNRFYYKGSRDRALIRTGAGGQKIVMDGGCLVLPFLHQVEAVDMRTAYIDIARTDGKALLTEDRLRVDVNVSFHVRVIPTIEGIATAAQTIGSRSLTSDKLSEFLKGRFIDALQSIVAMRTMDNLHENRAAFVNDVSEHVRPGLENSGLRLESVSLILLDQTAFSSLDENNAFNAVGMRRLAEIVTTNRRKRKEIESNADLAIRRTELENTKSRLALELEHEKAESDKNIETELLNAETTLRTAEERERAETASGQARLNRELELRRAEINRDQELRQAEVIALQSVEDARIQSQIDLAARRMAESKATADAELSRKHIIEAEETVQREKERLVAERTGEVSKLKAEQDAEVELSRAKGSAAAALVTAENESQVAALANDSTLEEMEVKAKGREAMIAAENEISESLIEMKLEEKRLAILPEMAEKMSRPLEKIGEIRINHVSGLGGSASTGEHKGDRLGNVVDDVLDLAFRMPAVRKLGEAVGAQITTDDKKPDEKD